MKNKLPNKSKPVRFPKNYRHGKTNVHVTVHSDKEKEPEKTGIFDLSESEIAVVRSGKDSMFWKTIQKVLKIQIDILTEQVLNDDDLSEPVEITQRDRLRDKLRINRKLYGLADEIADDNADGGQGGMPNSSKDPYARNMAELRAMQKENGAV